MKQLPDPEIYEQELAYMPYRESLRRVTDVICSQAPINGCLLDLMCGPGYLLGQISKRRRDLSLLGVDLDKNYIAHARRKHPILNLNVGDVLSWKPARLFEVVVCTGALHHIPYEKQEGVVRRIASMIKPNGFAVLSDCYIDDYSNETERRIAAAKLGYEYLSETIANGAPREVVEATIEILRNDVMMDEFKTSLRKRLPLFERHFGNVDIFKTWPQGATQYGDYYAILS